IVLARFMQRGTARDKGPQRADEAAGEMVAKVAPFWHRCSIVRPPMGATGIRTRVELRGRARPCQGRGRGFESLRPLHNYMQPQIVMAARLGPFPLFAFGEAQGKQSARTRRLREDRQSVVSASWLVIGQLGPT